MVICLLTQKKLKANGKFYFLNQIFPGSISNEFNCADVKEM